MKIEKFRRDYQTTRETILAALYALDKLAIRVETEYLIKNDSLALSVSRSANERHRRKGTMAETVIMEFIATRNGATISDFWSHYKLIWSAEEIKAAFKQLHRQGKIGMVMADDGKTVLFTATK